MSNSTEPGTTSDQPSPARKVRWSRRGLSLRALLILLAGVAVGLGAWANHLRQVRAAAALIRQHGGMYYFDFEYDPKTYTYPAQPTSWAPGWIRKLVGDENLHDMTYLRVVDPAFTDADFAIVAHFFPRVACMGFDNCAITDRSLALLRGNADLDGLFVKDERISDAGMDLLDIESLPRLSLIDVRGTRVTKAKVKQMEAILQAREAALRRAHPGKWVGSHCVLEGPFSVTASSPREQTRVDYERQPSAKPTP